MTIRWHTLAMAMLSAGLCACGTTYAPVAPDNKSDQYVTRTQLDAGATRVWETDVDLTQFRIVMLATQTNTYPLRFEFYARKALYDLGIKRVVNIEEMSALLTDRDLGSQVNSDSLRKLSEAGLPVLIVVMQSNSDGNVRRYVTLKTIDARNGKTLLWIDHSKTIWTDVDNEAHLPVLNALRKWYRIGNGRPS